MYTNCKEFQELEVWEFEVLGRVLWVNYGIPSSQKCWTSWSSFLFESLFFLFFPLGTIYNTEWFLRKAQKCKQVPTYWQKKVTHVCLWIQCFNCFNCSKLLLPESKQKGKSEIRNGTCKQTKNLWRIYRDLL